MRSLEPCVKVSDEKVAGEIYGEMGIPHPCPRWMQTYICRLRISRWDVEMDGWRWSREGETRLREGCGGRDPSVDEWKIWWIKRRGRKYSARVSFTAYLCVFAFQLYFRTNAYTPEDKSAVTVLGFYIGASPQTLGLAALESIRCRNRYLMTATT